MSIACQIEDYLSEFGDVVLGEREDDYIGSYILKSGRPFFTVTPDGWGECSEGETFRDWLVRGHFTSFIRGEHKDVDTFAACVKALLGLGSAGFRNVETFYDVEPIGSSFYSIKVIVRDCCKSDSDDNSACEDAHPLPCCDEDEEVCCNTDEPCDEHCGDEKIRYTTELIQSFPKVQVVQVIQHSSPQWLKVHSPPQWLKVHSPAPYYKWQYR